MSEKEKRKSANVVRGDDVIEEDLERLRQEKVYEAMDQMKAETWNVMAAKMLNGGRLISMKTKHYPPKPGPAFFSNQQVGGSGGIQHGPVFSEYSVNHAFGNGHFDTSVRLYKGIPRIDITNLDSLGVDAPIPALRYENSFQYLDNFTYIHGQHTIKFGGDFRRFRGDFFQISLESPRGHFAFDQNYTSNNGAAGTGSSVASVLLGYPAGEQRGVIYMFPSNRITQTFFFFQDDYKVSRKLTLNLGVRYELYFPVGDRWDNQANFDLRTGKMDLAARGSNSRALVNLDKNNWAPRFGFAYAWRPKTVVRGGYGISYYPDKFGATGGTLNNN